MSIKLWSLIYKPIALTCSGVLDLTIHACVTLVYQKLVQEISMYKEAYKRKFIS